MPKSNDVLAEIKAVLEENKEFYNFAVLRGVYINAPEGLKNVLTKIILMPKEATRKADEKLDFTELVLVKKAIDLQELGMILEKIFSDGRLMSDKYSCRVNITNVTRSHSPSNDFFDWSGNLFTLTCEGPRISRYQPLVEYSKPIFRDAYHAIDKWIDLHPFHGDRDARLGAFLIFLPEYRARINNIKYHNGKLFVKADFNTPQFESVRCKVLIKMSSGLEVQESPNFKKKEVKFAIESPPAETYLYLITPDGRVLDFYEETPFRHTGRRRLKIKLRKTLLRQQLHLQTRKAEISSSVSTTMQ